MQKKHSQRLTNLSFSSSRVLVSEWPESVEKSPTNLVFGLHVGKLGRKFNVVKTLGTDLNSLEIRSETTGFVLLGAQNPGSVKSFPQEEFPPNLIRVILN